MNILDQFYSSLKPDAVVLDLGAGDGKQAKRMTELGAKVIAVDRKPPKEADPSISWNILPIEEWVVKLSDNDTFDAILARNILQFFDKNMAVEELLPILSKHLKSGGLLAIETFSQEPVPPFERPFKSLWTEDELKNNFTGWEILSSQMQMQNALDLAGRPRDFYRTVLLARKP